jgi:hypothetical protein
MEKWRIETGPERERRLQKREREREQKKRTREDKPMPSLSAVHHLQLTNQSKKRTTTNIYTWRKHILHTVKYTTCCFLNCIVG